MGGEGRRWRDMVAVEVVEGGRIAGRRKVVVTGQWEQWLTRNWLGGGWAQGARVRLRGAVA